MMKATIEFSGMVHMVKTFEGDHPETIIAQLERLQDLECLVRMGPMFGDDVSSLEELLRKHHNGKLAWNDIKNMNIELSVGTIKCIDFQEEQES